MTEDSFHTYQEGQIDYLWDEYLDYVGLFNRSVDIESVHDWLSIKGNDISDNASKIIVDYVNQEYGNDYITRGTNE